MLTDNSICRSIFDWVCAIGLFLSFSTWTWAQQTISDPVQPDPAFDTVIRPLLETHCVRCHQLDNQESGVRVDDLSSELSDRQHHLLHSIKKQINSGSMPPEGEPQLKPDESNLLLAWIDRSLKSARTNAQRHGSVRRLTVRQYRNTLRDLLGLDEDFTDQLPPEAVSKDGFTNNAQSMVLSPLQMESYLDIASKAIDQCIVDESTQPVVQTFRMEFGKKINREPCADNLILGANSELLENSDFVVSEPRLNKSFEYSPFKMRTAYEFIEGYQGNDTVRGWRSFSSIYHSVFACVRGNPGYPKGAAYEVIEDGLLLRPAIPSAEIFGVENTYGPRANFKISLRELPSSGSFQVRVRATKYDDGMLLDAGTAAQARVQNADSQLGSQQWIDLTGHQDPINVKVPASGIYQIDVVHSLESSKQLQLQIANRHFSGGVLQAGQDTSPKTADAKSSVSQRSTAFMLVRLSDGVFPVRARLVDNSQLHGLVLTRLEGDNPLAVKFQQFEARTPSLGVHVGLRRDCGSTLTQVEDFQRIQPDGVHEYCFKGAINDYPSPEVEKDNVNYLAGIREIAVRSEFTDGRDMPRLLIRSIDFEGPFYEQWPPQSHRSIFIESEDKEDTIAYSKAILRSFATRAFRRPVTEEELTLLTNVWRSSFADSSNFVQSIKDALVVALTSPQFLHIVESSDGPQSELLSEYELASKLSFFLWNAPPDQPLMNLASAGKLISSADEQVDRMIADARFDDFVDQFASEWLGVDRFEVASIDQKLFPHLSRDVKSQLLKEPSQYLKHLIRNNLSLKNLVRSDFIVANETVANYYGLASLCETGFEFSPVEHGGKLHGGLITRAAVMSGLSNGRQANPVKRGAWFARKIIAEPPDDPPPNVPQIKDDDGTELTLREKLEQHRNQRGCVKCHEGIDPWGLPFEAFDAGGLFQPQSKSASNSRLPDGTEVQDINEFQAYLLEERLDQVAFSFLKHLASYAVGRTLNYAEVETLRDKGLELKASGYCARDMLHLITHSDLFLTK